jgi:pimeloyl-ACP methyl ester carboxylesterase
MLPFAQFLVRSGLSILTYDKRGVGQSTGDWNDASFEDLAGDVVAAFEYLKTRSEIDEGQVGLLGVSQAGWVLPIAAVQAPDLAFLISLSGAGIPAAETGIDHGEREMQAAGTSPQVIAAITNLMRLQLDYARTGAGWDEYARAREAVAARMGPPPDNFPAAPDDPYWDLMRRVYLFDPAPVLRQLRVPTLALFGELDNNILAEKNRNAWMVALEEGGHPDYELVIVPRANHIYLEAVVGNNAEIPTLRRFVPEYYSTIDQWLAERVEGFGPTN